MAFSVTVPASLAPVSLVDAKAHMRVEFADDDSYIGMLIDAAVDYVEKHTRRALMTQTIVMVFDSFPDVIQAPVTPLQSVQSVQYIDADNVQQTLAASAYDVDLVTEPARLVPSEGNQWPSTAIAINAVSITCVAGHPDAGSVPKQINQAIMLLVGHWYENREAVINGTISKELPIGVDALLQNYVIWL